MLVSMRRSNSESAVVGVFPLFLMYSSSSAFRSPTTHPFLLWYAVCMSSFHGSVISWSGSCRVVVGGGLRWARSLRPLEVLDLRSYGLG